MKFEIDVQTTFDLEGNKYWVVGIIDRDFGVSRTVELMKEREPHYKDNRDFRRAELGYVMNVVAKEITNRILPPVDKPDNGK